MNDLIHTVDVQMLGTSRPADPQNVVMYMRGNDAGVRIDATSAYRFTASWACIRVLSDTVAMLPWHGFARLPSGDREQLPNGHRLNQLLNVRPNAEMGSFSFRETMVSNALVWGNAYAEIERGLSGAATALWPIEPHRVQLVRDEQTDELEYIVDGDTTVANMNMFHLRGMGSNGLIGYYVLGLFSQAFATGLASERHAAQFFGQGAVPSGLLKSASRIKEDQARELIRSFEQNHMNKRRIGLLQPNMDYQVISANNEDSQLQETRQFQVQEMCRVFRVPPHKVSDLSRGTFSNIEQQETMFARDSISPWAIRLEQEANHKLIGPRGKRNNQYTQMNLNGLMRGDSESRVRFYAGMRDLGVLSPNDILRMEDMNSLGKEGDKRLVPLNMTTLERAGEDRAQTPRQPFPEQPEEQEEEEQEEEETRAVVDASAMRHIVKNHCDYFARITMSRIKSARKRLRTDEQLVNWMSSYFAKQPTIIRDKLVPVARTYLELSGETMDDETLNILVTSW